MLSVYGLNHAPDPALVARWWPATSLVTIMLILAPHQARPLAGLRRCCSFVVQPVRLHRQAISRRTIVFGLAR